MRCCRGDLLKNMNFDITPLRDGKFGRHGVEALEFHIFNHLPRQCIPSGKFEKHDDSQTRLFLTVQILERSPGMILI